MTAPPGGPVPISRAAAQTGVTAAALRVWDSRYGLAPGATSPGGHRRYTAADIGRIRAARRLIDTGVRPGDAVRTVLAQTVPTWDAPPGVGELERELGLPDDLHPAARELAAELARLDGPRTAAVLSSHLTQNSVTSTWDGLLRPVLGAIGDEWAGLPLSLAMEHVLCFVAQQALSVHAARTIDVTGPVSPAGAQVPAVLTTVPGEPHVLPLAALAAALAERAVPAVRLDFDDAMDALTGPTGAPLPVGDSDRTQPEPSPAAVVFALVHGSADPSILARLPAGEPPVIVAGPGWSVETLPAGSTYVNSLADAVSAVERHRVGSRL